DVPYALEFGFDAGQELGVEAQSVLAGDEGPRAVGADQHAAVSSAAVLGAGADLRSGVGGPTGKPAEQRRSVGGEEVVAGRFEIETAEPRGVEPHAADLPGERRRDVPRVGDFLHHEPRRVRRVARVLLPLEDARPESADRARLGAGEPREARSDDLDVDHRTPAGVNVLTTLVRRTMERSCASWGAP